MPIARGTKVIFSKLAQELAKRRAQSGAQILEGVQAAKRMKAAKGAANRAGVATDKIMERRIKTPRLAPTAKPTGTSPHERAIGAAKIKRRLTNRGGLYVVE